MDSIIEKLDKIWELIKEIDKEDPAIGDILWEGFSLSMNTIKAVAEAGNRDNIDISEHLRIISKALGVDLNELMSQSFKEVSGQQESNKEPDQATLDFITSDLDDYEKFLAQAKAKESLDFLSKSL